MQKKTEKGAGKQEGAGSYVGVGWGYASRARPQQTHTHTEGVRHRAQIGSEIIFNVSDKSYKPGWLVLPAWPTEKVKTKLQELMQVKRVMMTKMKMYAGKIFCG